MFENRTQFYNSFVVLNCDAVLYYVLKVQTVLRVCVTETLSGKTSRMYLVDRTRGE